MNEPAPWLSIGVPTFNRRRFLEKLLDSIDRAWSAAGWPASALEVVIVDNASEDDTWNFLQERRAPYLFRVFRNPRNIGPLPNFLRAMEKTTGDCLMVFGDDDEMEEDALSLVRKTTIANPGVISFCFWTRDLDLSKWVRTDTRMSLETLASRFFYYPGNCGLAAIRGAEARQAVAELNRRGLWPTTWVITDIFGIAARLSGEPEPILLSPVPVARYPNHSSNVICTSQYLFAATWLGQTRCAQTIDLVTGSDIARLVSKAQLWGLNGLKKLPFIFVHAHLTGDLEQDREETLSAALKAFKTIPVWGWPFCAAVFCLLSLPLWMKKALVWTAMMVRFGRSGPQRFRNLMERRKTSLERRLDKRKTATGPALYTSASWEPTE